MPNARSVRPTDLVALVSFDGQIYPNEAHTWDRLGRGTSGTNLLENALEHWFPFATGRHTWISIQGQTIRGVISARPRGSRLAWEVDCLIVAADDEAPVLTALLDQLTDGAIEARVLRIFLRLEAGSSMLDGVRRWGFHPLCGEELYRLDGELPATEIGLAENVVLRDRARSDGFGLYRLYNRITPERVRRLEAATYAEWIAAQEKRSQGRGRLDKVVACEDGVAGWVRAVPDNGKGRIDLLLQPEMMHLGPALLAHAASSLRARRPIFCLLPAYAVELASLLESAGFERDGEYVSLVKRLALPLREAKPVKVPAGQLVTAG